MVSRLLMEESELEGKSDHGDADGPIATMSSAYVGESSQNQEGHSDLPRAKGKRGQVADAEEIEGSAKEQQEEKEISDTHKQGDRGDSQEEDQQEKHGEGDKLKVKYEQGDQEELQQGKGREVSGVVEEQQNQESQEVHGETGEVRNLEGAVKETTQQSQKAEVGQRQEEEEEVEEEQGGGGREEGKEEERKEDEEEKEEEEEEETEKDIDEHDKKVEIGQTSIGDGQRGQILEADRGEGETRLENASPTTGENHNKDTEEERAKAPDSLDKRNGGGGEIMQLEGARDYNLSSPADPAKNLPTVQDRSKLSFAGPGRDTEAGWDQVERRQQARGPNFVSEDLFPNPAEYAQREVGPAQTDSWDFSDEEMWGGRANDKAFTVDEKGHEADQQGQQAWRSIQGQTDFHGQKDSHGQPDFQASDQAWRVGDARAAEAWKGPEGEEAGEGPVADHHRHQQLQQQQEDEAAKPLLDGGDPPRWARTAGGERSNGALPNRPLPGMTARDAFSGGEGAKGVLRPPQQKWPFDEGVKGLRGSRGPEAGTLGGRSSVLDKTHRSSRTVGALSASSLWRWAVRGLDFGGDSIPAPWPVWLFVVVVVLMCWQMVYSRSTFRECARRRRRRAKRQQREQPPSKKALSAAAGTTQECGDRSRISSCSLYSLCRHPSRANAASSRLGVRALAKALKITREAVTGKRGAGSGTVMSASSSAAAPPTTTATATTTAKTTTPSIPRAGAALTTAAAGGAKTHADVSPGPKASFFPFSLSALNLGSSSTAGYSRLAAKEPHDTPSCDAQSHADEAQGEAAETRELHSGGAAFIPPAESQVLPSPEPYIPLDDAEEEEEEEEERCSLSPEDPSPGFAFMNATKRSTENFRTPDTWGYTSASDAGTSHAALLSNDEDSDRDQLQDVCDVGSGSPGPDLLWQSVSFAGRGGRDAETERGAETRRGAVRGRVTARERGALRGRGAARGRGTARGKAAKRERARGRGAGEAEKPGGVAGRKTSRTPMCNQHDPAPAVESACGYDGRSKGLVRGRTPQSEGWQLRLVPSPSMGPEQFERMWSRAEGRLQWAWSRSLRCCCGPELVDVLEGGGLVCLASGGASGQHKAYFFAKQESKTRERPSQIESEGAVQSRCCVFLLEAICEEEAGAVSFTLKIDGAPAVLAEENDDYASSAFIDMLDQKLESVVG